MIRIGNASAFWGDSPKGAKELLEEHPDLDVLTLDYLAELTLSILAAKKKKDPSLGYAEDFLEVVQSIQPYLVSGKLKVITNAGGLNPRELAYQVKRLLPDVKVGFIEGDDVLSQVTSLHALETANAYIGKDPIVEALNRGAQIVIGGRIADPSLTVAAAAYHFGWKNDWNQIAQATLAGHLIECGRQVTGGISSEWMDLPSQLSYPVAEMESSGRFSIVGKEVTRQTVTEQLLYELFDPSCYLSPDVTASFVDVQMESQLGKVTLFGAKGSPPPSDYKVSATYAAGYKAETTLVIFGHDAPKKAQRAGEVLFERLNLPFEETLIELLGTGAAVPVLPPIHTYEVVLRLAVRSQERSHVEAFSKEVASLVTSGPPGTTGYASGRAHVRPVFGYEALFIPRELLSLRVEVL